MKRTIGIIGAIALAAIAEAQTEGAKPDFSGAWVEASQAPAVGPATGRRGAGGEARAGRGAGDVRAGRGAGEIQAARGGRTGRAARGGGGRRGGAARATLGSGWGDAFTLQQTESELVLQRDFFSRGDMQRPLKHRFALDGSETRNSIMMGRGMETTVSKAAWDESRLVITTLHAIPDPGGAGTTSYEVKRTLTLEGEGTEESPVTLVILTERGGAFGGPPSTTRTAYRKN